MADPFGDGEFWLPSEFLTDDDIIMNKENFNKNRFNTELTHEFSSVLSSPVESLVGSNESESDEEGLVTGLTRQFAHSTLHGADRISYAPQNLEKTGFLFGSPQSTLIAVGSWSDRSAMSSNGSPNGPSQFPSPPTTPFGGIDDSWDLIYAAAGQVARLKMNSEGPTKSRGLLGPPRSLTQVYGSPLVKTPNNGVYDNQCLSHTVSQTNHFQQVRRDQMLKQQSCSIWGKETKDGLFSRQQISHNRGFRVGFGGGGKCERPLGLPQSEWPSLQVQNQHLQNQNQNHVSGSGGMRAVFLGGYGTGLKRECAGTGVFLPRGYGNPTESRKKPGYSAPPHPGPQPHARAQGQPRTQSQARFNGAFIAEYHALMARKMAQLKQSIPQEGATNHEIRLPPEWTY